MSDSYTRICGLCEDIKEMACNKGNKLMVISWAEEIIKEVKKGMDKPSASPVKIHMNEWIRVKLTVSGIKAYIDYMNEPNTVSKNKNVIKTKNLLPKIDDEGYTTLLLWEFIDIFGKYFSMGNMEQVISPLEIIKDEIVKGTEEQKEVDGENNG